MVLYVTHSTREEGWACNAQAESSDGSQGVRRAGGPGGVRGRARIP